MKNKFKNSIVCFMIGTYIIFTAITIFSLPQCFLKLIAWIGYEEIIIT